ncbi:hypothetical protein JCM10212_002359 [Sporobolomyces blumeae]
MGAPPIYDLSALQAFLAAQDPHSDQPLSPSLTMNDPVVVADETAGMSFSELFSHYLAPEVAKLPPSSTASTSTVSASGLLPSFPDSAFSFGSHATVGTTEPSFDPSTFLPTIPGSPISPSETGSLSHSAASPMSFADLEDMFTNPTSAVSSADDAVAISLPNATSAPSSTDSFAIDPSIFGQAPAQPSYPVSPVEAFSQTSLPPLEPSSLTSAALPPLPSIPTAYDYSIPPPPIHSAVSASGRPKRHVAPHVAQDEAVFDDDEDDEDADSNMSDASDATTAPASTTATMTTRRAKRPAAKKARRSSSTPAQDKDKDKDKKLPKTSVAPLASDELYKTSSKSNLPPVPLWKDKPDEEAYAKLSSKEKRQMRNKISARNFRHRRKEYITTLEEEISTRDNLITGLKDEVGTLRVENSTLRSEVSLLKDKWQELLDKMSSLAGSTPPAPSTASAGLGVNPSKAIAASSSASNPVQVKEEEPWALDSPKSAASPALPDASAPVAPRRIGTRSTNGIQRPNLSKDVAPSTIGRRSTGSWTTQGGGFGTGGGFMPVHTTLVPDFASLASNLTAKGSSAYGGAAQSFNPNLNNLSAQQLDELPSLTSHLRSGANAASQAPSSNSAFQDLFSTNPFFLNPSGLEQQRAGLYSRIAHNASGLASAKKQQQLESNSLAPADDGFLPVPNGFRPAFFSSSSSSSSSASTPVKSTEKHNSPSTTTRELLAFQSPSSSSAPSLSHQDAYQLRLATLATQTLVSKMTKAFVAAFSGSSSPSSPSSPSASTSSLPATTSSPDWDGSKVEAVLSGQAKLQVVPTSTPDPQPRSDHDAVRTTSTIDELGSSFSRLNMASLNVAPTSLGSRRTVSNRTRSLSPSTTTGLRRNCSFDEIVSRWTTSSSSPTSTTTAPTKREDK